MTQRKSIIPSGGQPHLYRTNPAPMGWRGPSRKFRSEPPMRFYGIENSSEQNRNDLAKALT